VELVALTLPGSCVRMLRDFGVAASRNAETMHPLESSFDSSPNFSRGGIMVWLEELDGGNSSHDDHLCSGCGRSTCEVGSG
jgi:hypothetical protein